MDLIVICICSGCGKEFEKLETQLDGKDYCNINCFMEYITRNWSFLIGFQ